MVRLLVVVFAGLAALVTTVLWLLWEALVLVIRALPVVATWTFFGLLWTAEGIYDLGFWIGERIGRMLDRDDLGHTD